MDPLQQLLAQVDKLPTPPDMIVHIEAELNDPECDLRRVAELDTYVTEQKDHLKEVGTLVSSVFSRT